MCCGNNCLNGEASPCPLPQDCNSCEFNKCNQERKENKEDIGKIVKILGSLAVFPSMGVEAGVMFNELNKKFYPQKTLKTKEAQESSKSNWLIHVQVGVAGKPRTRYNGKLFEWDGEKVIQTTSIFCGEKYRIVAPQKTEKVPTVLFELLANKYTGRASSIYCSYSFENGELMPHSKALQHEEVNGGWEIEVLLPPETT